MRLSHLFARTLRQVPAEAETASHQLLLRAGLAAPVAAGVYAYLPLGLEVMRRIQQILREEMERPGPDGRAGQELLMPSLLPIDVYEASGRDQTMGDILFRFQDHHGRHFCLGPTHEEVFVEVFKRSVQSYRDMPLLLYQIAPKFRDEPRPRGGLIRLRQFIMKDLYSFDTDWDGLDRSFDLMADAYKRVFDRCGVPTVPVTADTGAMGGKDSTEFIYLNDSGEDSCLFCPGCGYAANAEAATFVKEPAHASEPPAAPEEVDTPGTKTIAELAALLGIPETKTCKAVFYTAVLAPDDEHPQPREAAVFVAIRGDMEVNEVKLKNALGALEVRPMDDAAVRKAGFVAGYASRVGQPDAPGLIVVADDLVPLERNLVAGANRPDKHLLNTNYGRDWTAAIVADIALATAGAKCATCGTPMDVRRGIEMGHIFKLGTRYSEMMGATFLDAEGKQRPAIMGSYGIGVERLLAAVIEEHHDDKGIIWPRNLAPYDVHLVGIQLEKDDVRRTAEKLYADLQQVGLRVLYDDREESPGVKFNDADLLGMPLRATVSPRNLDKGVVEIRMRSGGDNEIVPLDSAVEEIARRLA